ncbi:MAG: hypothetical protein RBT11_17465 [Desulfobacterales bacterium]|jgi:hypothetical protein|nr:hypothetical protein [Desulfobacterales bacterium]
MSKNILAPLMGVMIGLLLCIGCAASQNLLRSEKYRKEIIPNNRASFSRVWAVEENGQLKVSGKLRPKGRMRLDIPDYVELALVDKSGAVIAAQKVTYYPRVLTGRKHRREAKFSALFSEMPPVGTTIRVSNVN